MSTALVGIILGSRSDWEVMQACAQTLRELAIPFEAQVASAHRTPDRVLDFCAAAEAKGLKVIIAAAGGAAHLAGFAAAKTQLPVLAVPMQTAALGGLDSLLSMVQMPAGIPVGTFAIGKAGATNAALFAAAILALDDAGIRDRLRAYRKAQTDKVLAEGELEL
jgi:5-(carboxyamino)imidazole ribonucleotide mutase